MVEKKIEKAFKIAAKTLNEALRVLCEDCDGIKSLDP